MTIKIINIKNANENRMQVVRIIEQCENGYKIEYNPTFSGYKESYLHESEIEIADIDTTEITNDLISIVEVSGNEETYFGKYDSEKNCIIDIHGVGEGFDHMDEYDIIDFRFKHGTYIYKDGKRITYDKIIRNITKQG